MSEAESWVASREPMAAAHLDFGEELGDLGLLREWLHLDERH